MTIIVCGHYSRYICYTLCIFNTVFNFYNASLFGYCCCVYMDYSCSKLQRIIHLELNEIKYCCLVSAAKHLPTGHCLRPTAVPDLHDVRVREDGLGQ